MKGKMDLQKDKIYKEQLRDQIQKQKYLRSANISMEDLVA